MSERKVLTKYYPPDFDPSKISRSRTTHNNSHTPPGPKTQTVRLMAPFSMKCLPCGEYIYKGRKFNARKETTEEKYLGIAIYRFYIRCTRCSGEITFKTDPRGMDYVCERGARRGVEGWRRGGGDGEIGEEGDSGGDGEGAMEVLEGKVGDARVEMRVADALDEIRTRNARIGRVEGREGGEGEGEKEKEREREREREDEEAARRAFERGIEVGEEEGGEGDGGVKVKGVTVGDMPPPEFKRVVKKKKDFSAALGIKKKPSLV